MPRYVVERDFEPISEEEMQEVMSAATATKREHFPQVEWEHTHVCQGTEGGIKAFCVYTAPSAQILYDHAQTIEVPSTHRVYELIGDIDPRKVNTGAV